MQEKKNNYQPLGICHRLYNFFINTLIARGLKRLSMGHSVPQGSTQVLVGAKPTAEKWVHHQSQEKPKGGSGSEIKVHFIQTEGLESLAHGPNGRIDQSPWDSTAPVKDQLLDHEATGKRVKNSDILGETEIPLIEVSSNGNASQSQGLHLIQSRVHGNGVQPNATSIAQERGPQEIASIQSIGGITKRKENGKSVASDQKVAKALEAREEPKPKPSRHLDVTSNINEKSEAFIKSIKKKISRNLSMEDKKS
ncbi:hypothetical protein CFOL_v3_22176 [Cephalotus follicularis]|uniref:Uncharacterized protein n=1 Tax=Cephalotus follicularis TaxID=3775 RepID=A0A1Q3CF73_CEPFO|nr:hypothetical protein CFOL_v3_22176 [Cephalotus follicularis]